MKRTMVSAAVLGMVVIFVTASPASAMRDPGVGGTPTYRYGSRVVQPSQVRPIAAQGQYADGMNLYQYVRGNPVTRLDPSGLVSFPIYGYYCGTGNKWPGPTPPPPIDDSDRACQKHDACYAALGLSGLSDRTKHCGQRDCDQQLVNDMRDIWEDPTGHNIEPGSDGHKIARTIAGFFRDACNDESCWEMKNCARPTVKCSGRK